ncbi:tetratricopeptide repeat protein [uncultured Ruegeria sp.]|uniref:tetratricopeptide repeat protein n=1 Tax=uncultured Ruegeria sp. TaxID=259304 RepID=UPI002601F81F|nr:tetratricopeptide repeat protein [uncultured Ruegeria sp.]
MSNEVRRLSAIVAFDMVGYSRLMELDECGTLARQRTVLNKIINPKVIEFDGRVVKTMGDGALIEFASAVNAVSWAASVQRAMIIHERDQDADKRISYRIGINLGDILVEGDDIFGEGVNVASRLEGLAEPNGIMISDTVFKSVKGKLDLGFADVGLNKVKNLSEPIQAFKVLLDPGDAGKILADTNPISGRIGKPMVVAAVVLLVGLSVLIGSIWTPSLGDPDDGILIVPFTAETSSDRVSADMVTELFLRSYGRLRQLPSASYSTSMGYKGISVTLADLKRDIDVRYVLDGSVRTHENEIEIRARLRDATESGDGVIWEQVVEGGKDRLFDLVSDLKFKAAGALKLKLNPVERRFFEETPTTDQNAFLAYANADRLLHSKDFTDIGKALPLYEEAISLDPNFVEAKLGYAEANFQIWEGSYNTIRFTLDALDEAKTIVRDVLGTDPSNSVAIGLQVRLLLQQLQRDRALSMARAAVFNSPSEPGLRLVHGLTLNAVGDYEQAIEAFNQYEALSARLSSGDKGDLAWNLLRAGNSQKALSLLLSIPENELREQHFRFLAEAFFREGNSEKAREYIQRFLTNNVWLNVMWMKPWFEIYDDPNVFIIYSEAMLASGLPEWPYSFDKGREGDRIGHDELLELYSDQFEEQFTTGPFGAPYSEERRADGTVEMEFGWMNGIPLNGTWSIKDDAICQRLPSVHQGREQCHFLYRDAERSTETRWHVSAVLSFGVIDSEFIRLREY